MMSNLLTPKILAALANAPQWTVAIPAATPSDDEEQQPTPARPGFYTEAYPDPAAVTIAGLSSAAEDQEALATEHGEMAESVRALLAAVQRLAAENARLAAEVEALRAGRRVQIYDGFDRDGIRINPEALAAALRDLAGEAGELYFPEAGE